MEYENTNSVLYRYRSNIDWVECSINVMSDKPKDLKNNIAYIYHTKNNPEWYVCSKNIDIPIKISLEKIINYLNQATKEADINASLYHLTTEKLEEIKDLLTKSELYNIYVRSFDIFSELENQEIYCASKEELNDPMEGAVNVFWEGDSIIWENLINNYLMSILITTFALRISGSTYKLSNKYIRTFTAASFLKELSLERLYESFRRRAFKDRQIKKLPMQLEKKGRIGIQELIMHLFSIYTKVLDILMAEMNDRKPSKKAKVASYIFSQDFNFLIKELESCKDRNAKEKFSASLNFMLEERYLIDYYNNRPENNDGYTSKNISFISHFFPKLYVEKLVKNLYPDNYVAAFSSKKNSVTMWGHYAKGHKGICLEFDFDRNKQNVLSLPSLKNHKHKLYKINYEKNFPEINFFEHLGHDLSFSNLEQYWWRRGEDLSTISGHYNDEKKWREKYWSSFVGVNSLKHIDWKYESEWRVMFNGFLAGEIPKKDRFIHYDFSSLTGIIFGMNTAEQDKCKIIRIIEKKCKEHNRLNFKFYQAQFPTHGDKMQIKELKSLGNFK